MLSDINRLADEYSLDDSVYQEIVDVFFGDIELDFDIKVYEPSFYILQQFVIDGFMITWLREDIESLINNMIEEYSVDKELVIKDFVRAMTSKEYFPDIFETMELLGSEICLERALNYIKLISSDFNI